MEHPSTGGSRGLRTQFKRCPFPLPPVGQASRLASRTLSAKSNAPLGQLLLLLEEGQGLDQLVALASFNPGM
jgi:hypothetical protein